MVRLENEHLLEGFHDTTGALVYLRSKQTNRDLIRCVQGESGAPFAVWHDFLEEYHFADYQTPVDPGKFCRECLLPRNASFEPGEQCLTVRYALTENLVAKLRVTLEGVRTCWQLSLTNQGDQPCTLLPAFPCLDHVVLPEDGRMLGVNQTGAVDKIWAYPGGVYGNAADQSAQLGCLFHEDSCLGFYIEDETFIGKEIRYRKPGVQVRWFPEKKLLPGQTLELPRAVIMAYQGTWRKTAENYRDWFRSVYQLPEAPAWLRKTLSYQGVWFEKVGKPNSRMNGILGKALNDFTEMTAHYSQMDTDINEYAFYCQLSASEETRDEEICCGALHWHTDGVNEIREDLGGVAALREGVAKVHAIGKKVMLYVEGLIVPGESELFTRNPDARNWLYQNRDGSNDGRYEKEGFVHMCCGCEQWQDHLASICVRLVRETDVDGIRLDSFSNYHWPCYNPHHHHESPFDSNLWMQQLLSKVSKAVRAVKPDAILATEAAIDFNCLYMNMALDQYLDPARVAYGVEDCSIFRILFPEVYIPRINGGPVMESLQLLPDGCGELGLPAEEKQRFVNWRAARNWMGDLYTEGDIPDRNPTVSREDAQCRIIVTDTEAVLIAARIDFEPVYSGRSSNAGLQPDIQKTVITAELPFEPGEIEMFDVVTGRIAACDAQVVGNQITWQTESNWCCLRCRK